jgi:hypothetical protein
MGSLCYLGRGGYSTFLEEAMVISFDFCHNFFNQFIVFGSSILSPRYILVPQKVEKGEQALKVTSALLAMAESPWWKNQTSHQKI